MARALRPSCTALAAYRPHHKVRFVTAASLFDGHDAAINVMRRILQARGAEVIHLGHNRSVAEIVDARDPGGRAGHRHHLLPGRPRRVLQVHDRPAATSAARATSRSSAAAAASSSRARSRSCTPTASTGIFSPDDGRALGLQGMIDDMLAGVRLRPHAERRRRRAVRRARATRRADRARSSRCRERRATATSCGRAARRGARARRRRAGRSASPAPAAPASRA